MLYFKIFKGSSAGFHIDGRKKPSISEFINIAVHMSVILLAGSNLTNTPISHYNLGYYIFYY